jgi:hypothetical protein
MQQTNLSQVELEQSSSKLDDLLPTMVVWHGRAPSSGTNVPDNPSGRYPVREGQPVGTRQIGNVTLVDHGKRDGPEGVFIGGTPSQYTDSHPGIVERRFFPQGVESSTCYRVEQSVCIHSQGNCSRMFRPKGDVIGEYPLHSRLRKPSISTQPPTKASQEASRVPSQHHPGIRQVLYGESVGDYSNILLTVNPLDLNRAPTINDSGYGGSVRGSFFTGQRVKDKPPYDQFSNGETGGAEPCVSFDEGLGDQTVEHTGGQFPEIEEIQCLDILE